MEQLAYMFYFQLIFLFLDVTNQYAGLLFLQPHHPARELVLIHHGQQDVVDQNSNLDF